jgi:hypothetical protein
MTDKAANRSIQSLNRLFTNLLLMDILQNGISFEKDGFFYVSE